MTRLDWTVLLLYSYTTVVFLLRSPDGLTYQIGNTCDALLSYFMFRGLFAEMEDFVYALRTFALLLVPFVALVLVERFTHYNLFYAALGKGFIGASSVWIRGGEIRCFGSFRHPSLLGTLGATFLPVYIGLGCTRDYRKLAFIGIVLCLLIVYASNSGGPVNCAAMGVVGWMFWILRRKMRLVRISLVGFIVAMAIAMRAPIWYLPARASSFTGGDGWHRSHLMDVAMQNLDKWWFDGMPIQATANWFPYELAATGGADITNQYLSFAITSGLPAMILFIALLAAIFGALGKAMARLRAAGGQTLPIEYLLWGLGAMLVAHVTNWFGITYFDQTFQLWFMQLAAIATLCDQVLNPSPVEPGQEIADSPTVADEEELAPGAV